VASGPSAWERLINRSFAARDRTPLIAAIFSNPNVVEKVKSLSGDDAQAFIDVIDEASPRSQKNKLIESDSSFCALSIRHWVALIRHCERSVCALYTTPVTTTAYFPDHWPSKLPTTEWKSHWPALRLQTFGRVCLVIGRSQSRSRE
jgi:hypothetical protein